MCFYISIFIFAFLTNIEFARKKKYTKCTFKSLWMACPTIILPCTISATSFRTIITSSPAEIKPKRIVLYLEGAYSSICRHITKPTVSYVLGSDTADSRPVVCHLLRGFDEFIVNAFSETVHERHACQNAVFPVWTDSHHFTVDSHGSCETAISQLHVGT